MGVFFIFYFILVSRSLAPEFGLFWVWKHEESKGKSRGKKGEKEPFTYGLRESSESD